MSHVVSPLIIMYYYCMHVYFLYESFYNITKEQDLWSVYSLKQHCGLPLYMIIKKQKIKSKNSNYITHAVVFIQHTTKSMMSWSQIPDPQI